MNRSKLVLLHGPARVASRKKLLDLKQEFDPNNVVVFEEGSSIKDIADNLVSTSLFSDERLVILENPDENLTFDSFDSSDSLTLILWFDHELSDNNPILKWVKERQGQILNFEESKEISVFPFLDLLAAGNIKAFSEMKKLKDAGYDIFYFNTMVIYLLRNLINTPKNIPPFVLDKLQRQRTRLDKKKIISLYKDTLDLDFKLKKGLIELQQAEFFLVNKFIDLSVR